MEGVIFLRLASLRGDLYLSDMKRMSRNITLPPQTHTHTHTQTHPSLCYAACEVLFFHTPYRVREEREREREKETILWLFD